jgi:putative transposase
VPSARLASISAPLKPHCWHLKFPPRFHERPSGYQAASPALARLLHDDIAATWARDLSSAMACLDDDFEACIAHLRFPLAHRRAIWTTNLLERLFGEERRRTKVIPHAFGERAVLKHIYTALIRGGERWRGLRFSEFEHRQLKAIRDELDRAFTARTAPAAASIAPTSLSSKPRT